MLAVLTYQWGTRYRAQHVLALRNAVRRHLQIPHRFACVTDNPGALAGVCETIPFDPVEMAVRGRPRNWHKLRAFDAEFQRALGDRVLCLDLDVVITADMTPLTVGPEPFKIMRGTMRRDGLSRLCPYNGSIWRCDAGARDHVWQRFRALSAGSLAAVLDCHKMETGQPVTGSDQAWLAVSCPGEAVYTEADGVWQHFSLPGGTIPDGARMIFFAGPCKPWRLTVRNTSPALARAWQENAA